MVVERMQRLSNLEHDEVRHIDHVADTADANLFQGGTQPLRARSNLHAFYNPRRITRTQFGVIQVNGDQVSNTLGGTSYTSP